MLAHRQKATASNARDKLLAAEIVCQFPKCTQPIGDRVYYRRHKICPFHASLPGVVLDGRTLRWCQQCCKFEDIANFAGKRRSCRMQLDRHNDRRRMRKELELDRSSPSRQLSKAAGKATQGRSLMAMAVTATAAGGAAIDPSTGNSSWDVRLATTSEDTGSGPGEAKQALLVSKAARLGSSGSSIDNLGMASMDDSGTAQQPPGAAADWQGWCSGGLGATYASSSPGVSSAAAGGGGKISGVAAQLPSGASELGLALPDDDLAELLSWLPEFLEPPQQQAESAPRSVQAEWLQPLVLEPAKLGIATCPAPTPAGNTLETFADVDLERELDPNVQFLPPASSNTPAQTSAFKLEAQLALYGGAPPHPAAWPAAASSPSTAPAFGSSLALPQTLAGTDYGRVATQELHSPLPGQLLEPTRLPESPATAGPALPASFEVPRPSDIQEHMVRLSLKMFNIAPDELPSGLRQSLVNIVASDPSFVESFVRPGCTILTIVAMVCAAERERLRQLGAEGMARRLLGHGGWRPEAGSKGEAWAEDMLVQLEDEVAVVRQGKLFAVAQLQGVAPWLLCARPAAVLGQGPAVNAGVAGCTAHLLELWGFNLGGECPVVVARQDGRVLDLEILDCGSVPPTAAPILSLHQRLERVLVRVRDCGVGLLQFDVQRGSMLSAPASTLVLPTQAAVAEAQQAQRALAGGPLGRTFLRNIGWVLSQQLQQQQDSGAGSVAACGAGRQGPVRAALLAKNLLQVAESHGWQELARLLQPAVERGAEALRAAAAAAAAAPEAASLGSPSSGTAAGGARHAGPVDPLLAIAEGQDAAPPPSDPASPLERPQTGPDGAAPEPAAGAAAQSAPGHGGEASGSAAALDWAPFHGLVGGEAVPGPTEEEMLAAELVGGMEVQEEEECSDMSAQEQGQREGGAWPDPQKKVQADGAQGSDGPTPTVPAPALQQPAVDARQRRAPQRQPAGAGLGEVQAAVSGAAEGEWRHGALGMRLALTMLVGAFAGAFALRVSFGEA